MYRFLLFLSYCADCLVLLVAGLYPAFGQPRRDPCDVVQGLFRDAGYLVRDCSYMDPNVYWRIEHQMTWEGGRTACTQIPGGELASIHNFDEKRTVYAMNDNNFLPLFSAAPNDEEMGTWIGLRLQEESGDWRWSDGSYVNYVDWLTGQPSGEGTKGDHGCAQIASIVHRPESVANGGAVARGWADVSCRRTMKAICKAPRVLLFPGK